MNQEEVLQRLAAAGGYYADDHIVQTSGRHTDIYADFRVFYAEERKEELELFCRALADLFRDNAAIEFVVGPQRGGAIIAERVSVLLSGKHHPFVRPVIAFKKEGDSRGFTFYADDVNYLKGNGRCGLFVDDVLATASTMTLVKGCLVELGARIDAAGYMLNRSGFDAQRLGVSQLGALAAVNATSVTPEECAGGWLCKHGKPINTKVGHGAKFVAEHGQPQAP